MNYDLLLGDRGWLVDWDSKAFRGPASVQLLRNQVDTSGRPGEAAINPDDLWRRFITSWHHGAGQSVYDRDESDPFRFNTSSGVDVWTRSQLSLLHDVVDVDGPFYAAKVMSLTDVTGDWLYYLDGETDVLYDFLHSPSNADAWPASLADMASVSGATGILDFATDGQHIYATSGTDVYQFAPVDEALGSAWNTLDCDRLWYARGRLIAAKGPALYNITSSTAPTALFTHGNSNWEWTEVTESGPYIYAAGHSGDRSMIYKIGILTDGTALDEPVSAVQMPDGELIETVFGYVGFVFIGTSKGVRLASPDANGFLTYGALLPIGHTTAFEGDGNFVWAGTATDRSGMTGQCKLWRIDPRSFVDVLTPAYAEDLVAAAVTKPNGVTVWIESITTYLGRRVFTQTSDDIDDLGSTKHGHFYVESDAYVANGTLTSGKIRYGILDPKVATYLDGRASQVLSGSQLVAFSIAFDGGTPASLGAIGSPLASVTMPIASGSNVDAEVTVTMSPDGDPPVVTGMALRSYPAPARIQVWQLPLKISDAYLGIGGVKEARDAAGDLAYLVSLAATPDPSTTFSFGGVDYNCFVEEFQFAPEVQTPRDAQTWNGVCIVKLKVHGTVEEES